MKIRFIKNIDVDIDKVKLEEVWPKYINRHDIYDVDQIETISPTIVNVILNSKDVLLEVPTNSFEITSK
jgi:hypothetical protein